MNIKVNDDKIILNTNIEDSNKEEILNFIEDSKNRKADIVPTYNIEGEISGLILKLS
jgi:hypothetical protein